MKLDTAILRELAVGIDVSNYLRIMEARFRSTPTGTGFAETRFSSSWKSFTLLYLAQSLPTALAEKVIVTVFRATQRCGLSGRPPPSPAARAVIPYASDSGRP